MELSKHQQIEQIFQKEIKCAQMLLQSLDMEYSALAEHHTSALEEVVRGKQKRIQQLELISIQREKLIAAFTGVSVNKNNERNQNYDFRTDEQLSILWEQLVDTAEKCREKNRINGSIVDLISKQSRHALDILHGILPDSVSVSELYDDAGHTTKSMSKRTLAQV